MHYIPPSSDDRIRPFDSPAERLRKQIHQVARQSGKGPASSEQLMQALRHVVQLLHQHSPDLPECEQQQLFSALLGGIQEKTHKIKIRFIENH